MKMMVILSVLIFSGWAQASEYQGLFINEECANEECSKYNLDELKVAEIGGKYYLRVLKLRNNKQVCEFRGTAALLKGSLVATEEFTEWDNINHMLWKRACVVSAKIENGKATVKTNGRCEKWCVGTNNLNTKELNDINSYAQ